MVLTGGDPEREARSAVRCRAGLVGAGHIAEFHLTALRRLRDVEIVGVNDLDPARAGALASRSGLAALPSLGRLVAAGADVIHVLTPPDTHADLIRQALEAGAHVLVEKPLATDPADAEQIVALSEKRGLHVGVCHSLLFDPQVRAARDLVTSGRLGDVIAVDILRSSLYPPYAGGALPPHYRRAGYPFRDLGVHGLYLIEAFLGPIENVEASWRSLGGDPNLAFDEWRASVACERGLGQMQLSWNARPLQNLVVIQGTRAILKLDLLAMTRSLRPALPGPRAVERLLGATRDSVESLARLGFSTAGFALGRVRQYHGVQDYVAAFYEALAGGNPPPVVAGEAASTVRWTEEVARLAEKDFEDARRRLPCSPTADYLVTGASGALGSALVERLRSDGGRVRVFMRRLPGKPPDGVDVALGNLGNAEAVETAVAGARIVFHVGAAMKGGWLDHECATVEGTRNVIRACRNHNVEKLVHVSSLSVLDWAGAPDGALLDEGSPHEPRAEARGAYTRAKLEAERLVSAAAAEGLPAVILRPGQIFGGRIPLVTAAVARRLGGRLLILGDGEIPLPLVHLDDVVDALLSAARGPLRHGEVVHLVDPETLTQNQAIDLVFGGRKRVLRLPRSLVLGLGGLSELLLTPLGRTSPVSRYRLRSALAKRTFTSARAAQMLGWTPRVDLRERIRQAVATPPP
jgi:predicted dehydrogenase/nucleoside-diphosphate-sugar epimerase